MRSASSRATIACAMGSSCPLDDDMWRYSSRLGRDDIQKIAAAPAVLARSMIGSIDQVFVAQIVPRCEDFRVHQHDRAIRIRARLLECGVVSVANVNHIGGDSALRRRRRPSRRNQPKRKRLAGESTSTCVCPFAPSDRDRELLRVHLIHSRAAKRLHRPADGAIRLRRACRPPADRIRQIAKVLLERRRPQARSESSPAPIPRTTSRPRTLPHPAVPASSPAAG